MKNLILHLIERTMDIWDLGEAVRSARKERGLTQQQLADMAGVARNRVEGLENERLADIGLSTLSRILEVLQLDLRLTALNSNRPTLDDLQAENDLEDDHAPRMGRR